MGKCRTVHEGIGTVSVVSKNGVDDCKAQCAVDNQCVAIEYNPRRGQKRNCEIHTEAITHVEDKGDDAECWKKQATTWDNFVPPKESEGHSGKCRTTGGGKGTPTVVPSSSVYDCKAQCAVRSNCVAIEYIPSRELCEIHTENITHVEDKRDGTECWKKQAPGSPGASTTTGSTTGSTTGGATTGSTATGTTGGATTGSTTGASTTQAPDFCPNSNGVMGYQFTLNGYWYSPEAKHVGDRKTASACAEACDDSGCVAFAWQKVDGEECWVYFSRVPLSTTSNTGYEAYTKCQATTAADAMVPQAEYCVAPHAANSGYDCLCASGSGYCTGSADTWYGTIEDAKVKCNANAECLYLHDFNDDGNNWRACRSVDSPGGEEAAVMKKCGEEALGPAACPECR